MSEPTPERPAPPPAMKIVRLGNHLVIMGWEHHAGGRDPVAFCEDLAPARWFTRNTSIPPDRLRKEADAGWIQKEKIVGGQNFYSKTEAKRRLPHLWHRPTLKEKLAAKLAGGKSV